MCSINVEKLAILTPMVFLVIVMSADSAIDHPDGARRHTNNALLILQCCSLVH